LENLRQIELNYSWSVDPFQFKKSNLCSLYFKKNVQQSTNKADKSIEKGIFCLEISLSSLMQLQSVTLILSPNKVLVDKAKDMLTQIFVKRNFNQIKEEGICEFPSIFKFKKLSIE